MVPTIRSLFFYPSQAPYGRPRMCAGSSARWTSCRNCLASGGRLLTPRPPETENAAPPLPTDTNRVDCPAGAPERANYRIQSARGVAHYWVRYAGLAGGHSGVQAALYSAGRGRAADRSRPTDSVQSVPEVPVTGPALVTLAYYGARRREQRQPGVLNQQYVRNFSTGTGHAYFAVSQAGTVRRYGAPAR